MTGEIDDEMLLQMERLNNPRRVQSVEDGINNCPCPTCSRLRDVYAKRWRGSNGDPVPGTEGWADYPQIDSAKSPQDYPVGWRGRDTYGRLFSSEPTGNGGREWQLIPEGADVVVNGDNGPRRFFAAMFGVTEDHVTVEGQTVHIRQPDANAFDDFLTEVVDERQWRKDRPIATGVLAYFPDAIREVARVSKVGNDQHNPGEPLHWAREKSTDEADALSRHLIDYLNGEDMDNDGVPHLAKVAWRALALLQRWCDGEEPGR